MRAACSKGFLLTLTTLLSISPQLAHGDPAAAQFPNGSLAGSWLTNAASEKQCPLNPINLVAGFAENNPGALMKRITVSGGKLQINGTDNPDHIVVSADQKPDFVHVAWNGWPLGRFGPVSGIVIEGNGGDDVLIVKSGVTLPALLKGGTGDDCLQGGSGGDQLLGGDGNDVLIAGTGRPELNAGTGDDRIIIPQTMGTLRYAPSADSGVLQMLSAIYNLQPLGQASTSSNANPSPIILGAPDMGDAQVTSTLLSARDAGQAVVLTNASDADSQQLRLLLGQPNGAHGQPGATTGLGAGGTAPLIFYRKAPRPGTKANDYSTGFFITLSAPLDDRIVERLSRVFSATPTVPQAPADTPSNDLQVIADSYTFSVTNSNPANSGIQIVDSIWDVRSFNNQADFYYVLQEADYWVGSKQSGILKWNNSADNQITGFKPTVIQTSPASTHCSVSTTSGVTWNVGGTTGWNQMQGLNAALTGGVSVSNSQTITCPAITIVNESDPSIGATEWTYDLEKPQHKDLISFFNQWVWEIPFSSYQAAQKTIDVASQEASTFTICGNNCEISAGMTPEIPLPFGDTFALQQPVVSSVNPTCANAGSTFAINGAGLYPSLVTSVLIDGAPLSTSQYTTVNDTQINVVAPQQSGEFLPIVVQTGEGVSNSNVTIEISAIDLCSVATSQH